MRCHYVSKRIETTTIKWGGGVISSVVVFLNYSSAECLRPTDDFEKPNDSLTFKISTE